MKVLYIADRWDPKDHNQASGIDYEIYHALKREGAKVEIVGPFDYDFSILERAFMALHDRIFETKLFKYPFSYFFKSASRVNHAIENSEHDLVVTLYSAPLVFAKLRKPLLYFCDSTVKWLKKQWRNHARFTYLTMSLWETHVINKSDHIITFSESNAIALQEIYRISEEKIDTFTVPASIPYHMVPKNIEEDKSLNPVKLLLVGRDYHRKGVDIALEIVEKLNGQGVKSKLRIVGLDGKDSDHSQFMGLYDKTIPSELENYLANYKWANFMIHPARFEAAGIVPSEAAAFGVPTITNNTGGLGTTVEDGVSGIVLPKDSSADLYVSTIIEFISNPSAYKRLVESTKDRYQRELHWHAAGKRVYRIAQEMI